MKNGIPRRMQGSTSAHTKQGPKGHIFGQDALAFLEVQVEPRSWSAGSRARRKAFVAWEVLASVPSSR